MDGHGLGLRLSNYMCNSMLATMLCRDVVAACLFEPNKKYHVTMLHMLKSVDSIVCQGLPTSSNHWLLLSSSLVPIVGT